MNSSMIAINRPSNELPAKSQANQKAASGSDVFGNLLKQKLNSNVSDVKEIKSDTVKKPNAMRDLQARRMNKPEIAVNGQSDFKDQKSSIDSNQASDAVKEPKLGEVKNVEQSDLTENTTKLETKDESNLEKPLEEKTEEIVKELMPLLDLLKLFTEEEPVNLEASLSKGNEAIKTLRVPVEQLKNILTDLSLKLNGTNAKDVTAALESLKALSTEVENLLQTMIQTPSDTPLNSNAFNKLLENLEKTVEKVNEVLPNVQKQTPLIAEQKETSVEPLDTDSLAKKVAVPEKTELNSGKDKHPGAGNEKSLSKSVERVEVKSNSGTHQVNLGEFQAKLESASVAFNTKVDIPQSGKMTLQQMIMDQLTNTSKMQVRTTEAGTMMSMKLNPEVLGNVEIKLEIVKNVLQAEINVENMIVKGAIESNLSDLKNALSDKGYQVDQLSVSVGDKQSNNQGRQQGQNQEATKWQVDDLEEKDIRQMKFRDLTEATLSYLG